jgi:TamB, inner membrane protein subunit of TAM complex/AsmA family
LENLPQIEKKKTALPVRIFKILGWAFGIIAIILLLTILGVQIPGVQQFALQKTTTYLEKKFGTPVRIEKVSVAFPKIIVLENVFIAGSYNDTLLYGKYLGINMNVFSLLFGELLIDEILLKDITANLHRDTSAQFNFNHIISAFAAGPDMADDNSKKKDPIQVVLDRLNIDRAQIRYYDEINGIEGNFGITQLRSGWGKPDLPNQEFTFNNLEWNGGSASIKMWPILKKDNDPSDTIPARLPEFFFKEASISEVDFTYSNKDDGMDMDAWIGNFKSEGLNLALNQQLIELGTSSIYGTSFSYRAGPSLQTDTTAIKPPNWIITGKNVSLAKSNFQYDDTESPAIKRGMDYGHLGFSRINLKGSDLYISGGDTVRAKIESGSLNEKSGLKVTEFRSDLLYTTTGVQLKDLSLITPSSRLERSVSIAYPSPSFVAENPGELWMDAVFKNARLSHRDLLMAVPLLYEYPMFADLPNAVIEVDGKVKGKLKDLTLTNVTAKAFGGTRIKGSGRITGLPDTDNISTNLTITEFTTTDKDIRKLIPAGIIPDYVTLPANLTVRGKITGKPPESLLVDLIMKSSMGGAVIKGFINHSNDSSKAVYDIKGRLIAFEAGKLTGNSSLGKQTLSFSAKGKGYEPSIITGQFAANIESSEYDGIAYRNIKMQATADRGVAKVHGVSTEAAHDFEIHLDTDMRGEQPNVNSVLDLRSLDLKTLGFSDKTLTVSAKASMNFSRFDIHNPDGSIYMTDLKGIYDTTRFQFDTLSAIATFRDSMQTFDATTDFGTADIKGRYSVTELVPELINFVNQYYTIAAPSPSLRGDQQAKININIQPTPAVLNLIPGLKMQRNLELALDFNSRICLFDLEGTLPFFEYGGQNISGGNFYAESNDSAIAYKIFVDNYIGGGYKIPTILLQGDVLDHKIYSEVRLLDSLGKLQHTLSTRIQQKDSGYSVHVDPNSVLLNYEKWGLDPGNELYFTTSGGLNASSFTFSNGSQALVLDSYGEEVTSPIGIRLFNFKLSTFTSIARQDSLYLDGTLNGYAELMLSQEHPAFFADLTLENLLYKSDTIGNIVFKVNNEIPDVYKLQATLSGYESLVSVAGEYNGATDFYDFQFDIEKLVLSKLQPFAMGYLTQLKGHIEGGLSLTGNKEYRSVFGNLLFRDAEANVPLLNSIFSLKNERIRFTKEGIYFDAFTLTDQNNRKAILNGTIATTNWIDYLYKLDFEANDFRVVNSTRRDNKLFYGTLYLDSKIRITGTTERPDINATFRANDKTDFTMVLPQEDPDVAEREGVVEFFDADITEDDSLYQDIIDSLSTTDLKGLNINANFEVDERAKLSFVIDEGNGDMVVAKGKAVLTGAIDPSGKISVTGTYELKEGSYDMSLKGLMKFKFQIESGSTITWTGEPTDADINITALYNVKTAPYDLVEQQINSESDETKAKYRDRIPFRVKLKMRGELLKPDISFDIEMAETSGTSAEVTSTINSKLDQLRMQESEMNKQVFALILMGSFVPDNPFGSSSNSESVNAFARQSVSKLLSDQLNTLAGSLISGVDVDIGIESDQDYSTGSSQARTDLNVAFSKRLLQDRLKITVGSNFELEGASRPNEKTSNIAGDIKADYLLSRSGQYVLRAYRLDQYEVALQGQVVETGLTFIITLDFDHFREIFEKKKKQVKPVN